MNRITTSTKMPPEIIQHFNSKLLCAEMRFNHDLESLYKLYTYIINVLLKKAHYNHRKLAKCLQLKEEFLKLYERTAIKKEELEEKTKNKTQMPFYRITVTDKSVENIFDGLRDKSGMYFIKVINNSIQKI